MVPLDLAATLGIDRAREFIKHGGVRVCIFVSQEGVSWIIHIGLVLAAHFEDQFFISFFVGVLIDQPNDSCSLTFVAALTLTLEGNDSVASEHIQLVRTRAFNGFS